MAQKPLPDAVLQETLKALQTHGNKSKAAKALGISFKAMSNRVMRASERGITYSPDEKVTVFAPASPNEPIEDLVARRIEAYARRKEHEEARSLIPVLVDESLPIGILHFGDPHVDDDGCDLAALKAHAELVNATPGLYAANVGDTTNNWVGRLARLYASQGTTDTDAWRLAEWFVHLVKKWLYMVGGNHDGWSGAGDPLRWIARQSHSLYQDSEVRIGLQFANGEQRIINCRHDFNGRSMWNPAHGPMKAIQMGVRDDIAICGHWHESAYGVLKDPGTGNICHGIKVASYKVYDRYAREKNLKDQHLSPCALTVIDPRLPRSHPDGIKVFWDPFVGAQYLTFLRGAHDARPFA